jgi:hypothetical protein
MARNAYPVFQNDPFSYEPDDPYEGLIARGFVLLESDARPLRWLDNHTPSPARSPAPGREDYVGEWLPEPLLTTPDVAEDVELAESVSIAMLSLFFIYQDLPGLPTALRVSGRLTVLPTS